uniref:Putative secreted peptide n=1 Tax=Anopheles braziliensis TaxID=58242 RepID=A0A2M3ZVQ4_9DIPT
MLSCQLRTLVTFICTFFAASIIDGARGMADGSTTAVTISAAAFTVCTGCTVIVSIVLIVAGSSTGALTAYQFHLFFHHFYRRPRWWRRWNRSFTRFPFFCHVAVLPCDRCDVISNAPKPSHVLGWLLHNINW